MAFKRAKLVVSSGMGIPTKALGAYLVTRNMSLASAFGLLGLDAKGLQAETISDAAAGRIARLLGMTPEKLALATATHAATQVS